MCMWVVLEQGNKEGSMKKLPTLKKILTIPLFAWSLITILLWAGSLHATTYYANGLNGQNINYTTAGAGWYTIQGASCVATGVPVAVGSFANGDVLNANGCTALAVNVDPGAATGASANTCGTVTVTVTLTTDATNGGGFTYATASNLVLHMNVGSLTSKTTVLAISGSTGGGTICGNVQGGGTAAAAGITDNHTLVTVYGIGNITGGSASTTYGWTISSAGPITLTSIITAGTSSSAIGFNSSSGSSAVTAIIGSCVGSNTSTNTGCAFGAPILVTFTGSIINGLRGAGVQGPVMFTSTATNYAMYPKDSSYTLGVMDSHAIVLPMNPGAANVTAPIVYGPFTGTASASGGPSATGGW